MTKEQIAALIAAKITGQGSMVDIGGALPEILTALAENGISTDMTVAEQMQARKNLGLYYEAQEPGEKTVRWTDESQSVTLPGWAKISDDTPAKDDIISFAGETGNYLIFIDQTDGYVVTADDVATGMEMRIVLDDSDGHEPGIYYSWNGREFSPALVYTVLVDTVHKVPVKFLPVAWNQLVTEGTKIAEVTIGEETTNVFAPEGGGSGVYVAHASQDFQESAGANLSAYFENADDITAVLSGDASVIEIDNSNIKYSFLGKYSSSVYYISGKKILTLSGIAQYCVILFGSVPSQITITGLPTASMTTQADLDAIGLTQSVINKILSGEIICLSRIITTVESEGREILPICSASDVPPEVGFNHTITIIFESTSNRYKIVKIGTSVTVTVTQLS